MARKHAGSTRESGSALQPLPDAYGKLSELFLHVGVESNEFEFRALTNAHEQTLRVYSTGDGLDVYEDGFMDIAKPDGMTFQPTLLLVSTRLGIDKITPVYWEALIASLQMKQSVGIAG